MEASISIATDQDIQFPYSQLFYGSLEPMIIYDFMTETVLEVNDAILKLSEYSKAEFLKIDRFKLTPEYSDTMPGVNLHTSFLLTHSKKPIGNKPFSAHGIFLKKSGEEFIAKTIITPTGGEPGHAFITFIDKTRNLKKKTKLLEVESRYKSIVEGIEGAITIVDQEGKHLYLSPKVEDILGYKEKDLLGKSALEFSPPDQHPKMIKFAETILKGLEQDSLTFEYYKKDGSSIWLEGKGSLVKDKSGKIIGIQSVFFEVTKRVLLEKQLQIARNRYESIFDNGQEAIIYYDLNTEKAIDCNRAALKCFGMNSKKEMEKFHEYHAQTRNDLDQESIPYFLDRLKEAYEQGSANYKLRWTNPEGAELILQINLIIDDTDPLSKKALFFIKDVTKAEIALNKLSKERELLQAIIEGTPDKIIVQNANSEVIAANSSFKKKYQSNGNQDIEIGDSKQIIEEIISRSANSEVDNWDIIKKELVNGNTYEVKYSEANPLNGEPKHYSLLLSPLINADQKTDGIVGVSRNITELVTKENLIVEKNKELQKYIDSNIELENFAYIASHDLKQPLRTILNFTKLLKDRKSELIDDEMKTYINFISDSSGRLNELINDMLEYSVIGTSGEKEKIDMNELVDNVCNDLHALTVQKSARINIGQLPKNIYAVKSEIHSLMINLISNAIKYSKEGVIPIVKVKAEEQAKEWQISIEDNGIGINPKNTNRIFGMFQRLEVSRNQLGSGIGLAHCRKIIELHEGKIWVESKEGEGSTFIFSIPK